MMFRDLSEGEAESFRKWARENYLPHSEIKKGVWHPAVVEECLLINAENYLNNNEKEA